MFVKEKLIVGLILTHKWLFGKIQCKQYYSNIHSTEANRANCSKENKLPTLGIDKSN